MSKPIRILVIEDSVDDAELMVLEFEKAGYDPTWERVETPGTMRAALGKKEWDIIISDYSMPHFSGPDALKLMQEQGFDLPFIIISGTVGEDVAVECMKTGAHDYLMKNSLIRLIPAVERELLDAEVRRQRKQAHRDLNERVKELHCLYSIAIITERPTATLDEVYQEVANVIPLGWQYPDITCAKVTIDNNEFMSPNYRETTWKQEGDIIVDGQRIGTVEVFYLVEKPEGDEGPFQKEERNLINSITRHLGDYIQRKRAEEAKEHLYLMLRTIRNVNQLIVKEKNRDRLIKSICSNFTKTRGFTAAWIALLDESGRFITVAESGWGKAFLPMVHRLKQGELPDCVQKALSKSTVVLTEESSPIYTGCHLAKEDSNLGTMTTRLEHNGKIYGLLSAYIPARFLSEPDECSLFEEIAGDIGFAMHSMELEEVRKRAEEEIKEKAVFVQQNPAPVFSANYEGLIIALNHSAQEVSKDLKIGKPVNAVLKNLTKSSITNLIDDVQIQIEQSVGSKTYLFTIKKDSETQSIYFFGSNITERKKLDNKLKDSEIKYHGLFENSSEFLFTLDLKGSFTDMNKAAEILTGYSKSELLKMNFKDYTPKKDHRKLFRTLSNIHKTGKPFQNFPVKAIMKDGAIKYFETSFTLLKKGEQIIGFQGSSKDITDRRMAEEALQTSEAYLSNALTLAKLGYWEYDVINDLFTFNDQFYDIFHITAEEAGGYKISSEQYAKQFIHPDDISVVSTETRKAIETTDPNFSRQLEHRIIRSDGEIGYISVRFFIVKDSQGRTIKTFGINQDITKIKLFEQELIQAKNKAEESDRLKSAFLANMSHEIRTPMNGILGFAQLLREPDLTGEEQQKFLGVMEKSGERMLNIITDIVNISKIESGQMKITVSETNVNEQIEFVYNFFKLVVEEKGMQFLVKNTLSLKEAIIKTDREKIFAILTNLVGNAVKFTQTGSIEFGYEKKGKYLEFFVKDTGDGIADEKKEIIFERFRQGSESMNRDYEGAGLGLSISKAYVEILGGKIWVESELGKGSIFYFTLPYNAEPEAKIVTKESVSVGDKDGLIKNLKILIAEDDEASEMFLSTALTRFDTELLIVRTGVEAVEICRNNPDIDLILMDIKMPEMGGYEATRQIREFNKEVVIIAQTAYGLSGDREKVIEAGCTDYISKPVDITLLKALIKKYFK